MSGKIEIVLDNVDDICEKFEMEGLHTHPTYKQFKRLFAELKAATAAPVVERQPVAWFKHLKGSECKSDGRTYDLMFCPMDGYQPLFDAPPELAELQATVDHLRNDLEGTRLLAADQLLKINRLTAENERLRTEIERLKGGQGEPAVLVELAENKTYGGMHIAKWDNPGGLKEGFHKLYASQPAPVSVVLPERRVQPNGFTGKGWAELRGWNACLDKVKELNQ